MAGGATQLATCSYCRGPHPTGMCLTWIVAHDPGSRKEVPERHVHCERCGRGYVVTLEQLRETSPKGLVQQFIRKHAGCRERR
jgi:hypothetical protein